MRQHDDLFHQARIWENYGLTIDYQERVAVVTELIPDDVNSVLDVGCGKGEIIDYLATTGRFRSTVGIDASAIAVKHLSSPRAVAMLPHLPFVGQSFDVVICLQVLEHLDENLQRHAISEMQRVTNQYLILGVPYKENLLTKTCLCAECGKTSHVDGHLRAYDEVAMKRLAPEFSLRHIRLVGTMQMRHATLSLKLRHKLSGVYHVPEFFSCPYCGSTRASTSTGRHGQLLLGIFGLLNRAIQLGAKPMPYWIICLYERNTASCQ